MRLTPHQNWSDLARAGQGGRIIYGNQCICNPVDATFCFLFSGLFQVLLFLLLLIVCIGQTWATWSCHWYIQLRPTETAEKPFYEAKTTLKV